jgi:hypothetical protein
MAKAGYSVLCVVAVFLAVLSGSPSCGGPLHSDNQKLFEQHMIRVSSFGCREPQMRVVQLKDLGIDVKPDTSYYPSATVLRRCDCATGYCPIPEHVCRANDTVVVELVFRMTNQVQGGERQYMPVPATEDVSCSCQPIANRIK